MSLIRVALDLGESTEERKRTSLLLSHSEALGKNLGAKLELVHVSGLTSSGAMASNSMIFEALMSSETDRVQKQIHKLASSLSVRAQVLVIEGHPVDQLLRNSTGPSRPSILVIGTHGRTGLKRLLLGSVAEELVRRSSIPVVTVGPKVTRPRKSGRRRPVYLVGSILGPNSRQAEALAATLARKSAGEVVLYHCLYEGLHPVLQSALSTSEGKRKLGGTLAEFRERAERSLHQIVTRLVKSGVEARFELDEKRTQAWEGLIQCCSRTTPDYVLLGTHGRNAIGGAFFGSTVRNVILNGTCPVITIKS